MSRWMRPIHCLPDKAGKFALPQRTRRLPGDEQELKRRRWELRADFGARACPTRCGEPAVNV
jgi:hypothetical protein